MFCLSGAFGSPSGCCLMGPLVVAGTREGAELSILIMECVIWQSRVFGTISVLCCLFKGGTS